MASRGMDERAIALIADIRKYLKTLREPILGSADDVAYFRKKYKPPQAPIQQERPVRIAAPPEIILPPAPLPPPIELKKEEKKAPLPEEIRVDPLPKPKKELKEETKSPFQKSFWKALFTKIAPNHPILEEIPSDALAKKIATRWKAKNQAAPVTVLFYQEIPEQKALLEKIAVAIDVCLAPAKFASADTIEKEKQWGAFLSAEGLQCVICCDYTLWQLPGLLQFYKEVPNQKTRMLKEKQLFLLPDLSLYLKDPLLKRSLWKALTQTLSSLPSSSTET